MPLTNWYSLNWITNDYKSYVTRQQSTMKQLIRHRTKCCQLVGQCRFQYWWITDFEMLLVLLLTCMHFSYITISFQVFLSNLSHVHPTLVNGRPVIDDIELHHMDIFTILNFRWEEYCGGIPSNAIFTKIDS